MGTPGFQHGPCRLAGLGAITVATLVLEIWFVVIRCWASVMSARGGTVGFEDFESTRGVPSVKVIRSLPHASTLRFSANLVVRQGRFETPFLFFFFFF